MHPTALRTLAFASFSCLLFVGCANPDPTEETTSQISNTRGQAFTTGPSVTYSGCTNHDWFGFGSKSVISSMVPSQYILATDPASAVTPVGIVVTHCDSLKIDGREQGPATWADIVALIVSPDGTGTNSAYRLWQYTDSPAYASVMARNGIPIDFRPQLDYAYSECGAPACPMSASPHHSVHSPFVLTGTVVQVSIPVGDDDGNFWYETPTGPVKSNYHSTSPVFHPATYTLTGLEGELADVFGSASPTVSFFQGSFSYEGQLNITR